MSQNTSLLQRNISRVFPNKTIALGIEFLLLFLIGALAVAMHERLKIPIKLPGKHGLLFMFMLCSAKIFFPYRISGLLFALGGSTWIMMGGFGPGATVGALSLILTGILFDMLSFGIRNLSLQMLLLPLVCGLSYMMIPLSRILIVEFTGMFFPSLMLGYGFPLLTHFLFGAAGGFLAVLLLQKKNQKQ